KRLDVWVHTAATMGAAGLTPVSHADPREFAKIEKINFTGVYRLIRSLEPLLRASDAGRAIHFTTSVARAPRAFWGAYAATKAGAEALVKAWADEIESTPVRAAIVDPGRMRTRLRAQAFPGEDPSALPDPAEIGPLVVELARPDRTPPLEISFRAWKAAAAWGSTPGLGRAAGAGPAGTRHLAGAAAGPSGRRRLAAAGLFAGQRRDHRPGRRRLLSGQARGGRLGRRGLLRLGHPLGRRASVALGPRLVAALGIGIGPRLDRQPHRRAGHVETLAQAVDQITLVLVRHLRGAAGEQHERRRPRLGLGHVFRLDPAPGHRRRRVPLHGHGQPVVQVPRLDLHRPGLVRLQNRRHQPLDPLAGVG